MLEARAFIPDSDGTMVDTVPLIRHGQYETATAYLLDFGVAEDEILSYEAYETHLNQQVGGSARHTLEMTIRAGYRPELIDGVDFDALNKGLDPVQDKIADQYIQPHAHLEELLRWVGESGLKFGIPTSGTAHQIIRNLGIALGHDVIGEYSELHKDRTLSDDIKLEMFTSRLKEIFGLREFVVVDCDQVGKFTKPHRLSVDMLLEQLGTSPAQAVSMGDHTFDMQMAASAGVPHRIGVTHGFEDRATLLSAGATHIADSLDEVPEIITSIAA
jgi:phosphoglycolate phosphatase-like HAD superfamily hydrolase